jgi:antitoxin component of RelBE/YafQ-DinJ toxin-antitoxin module
MLSFSDMTQVIYVRVPESLKDAADSYSEECGVTLTSAVVDLLGRGLAAVSDEKSISDLEAKLALVSGEKIKAEAHLTSAMSELSALRAFARRAAQKVGSCPNPACHQTITGYELLALNQCNHCEQPLMDLLAPKGNKSTLDQREIGVLFGALGAALLGVAIVAAASS